MRSRSTYELLEGKTCHFDAAFTGSPNCDCKLDTFVSSDDQLDEMGLLCSRSSNEREPVQTGVREGRVVIITRSNTDFPHDSTGRWSGNVYQIIGDSKIMYESRSVPEDLQRQLGAGDFTIEGKRARIRFRANNGDLNQHFL